MFSFVEKNLHYYNIGCPTPIPKRKWKSWTLLGGLFQLTKWIGEVDFIAGSFWLAWKVLCNEECWSIPSSMAETLMLTFFLWDYVSKVFETLQGDNLIELYAFIPASVPLTLCQVTGVSEWWNWMFSTQLCSNIALLFLAWIQSCAKCLTHFQGHMRIWKK